jgi:SAM-dependent methyltransferase
MPMPAQQQAMARTRYEFAALHSKDRDILELACGTGFGVEYLADVARAVTGADIATGNLEQARRHVPGAMFVRLDGHDLPFGACSFDTVIVFEAVYYFADPRRVLGECRRVLRPQGSLLLSLPNPERRGFHASPHSVEYFSLSELDGLLRQAGFRPELFGGFSTADAGVRERVVGALTGFAQSMRIVPRDLRGRARIKRLLYGKLPPFEGLRSSPVAPAALVPLEPRAAVTDFKTLYARGELGGLEGEP